MRPRISSSRAGASDGRGNPGAGPRAGRVARTRGAALARRTDLAGRGRSSPGRWQLPAARGTRRWRRRPPRSRRTIIRIAPGRRRARTYAADGRFAVRVPEGRLEPCEVAGPGRRRAARSPGASPPTALPGGPRRTARARREVHRRRGRPGRRGPRSARHTMFTTSVPDAPLHRLLHARGPRHRRHRHDRLPGFNRRRRPRGRRTRRHASSARPAVEIARRTGSATSRLDFRPGSAGSPGTEVTVELRLRDVEAAPGRLRDCSAGRPLHRRPRPGQRRRRRPAHHDGAPGRPRCSARAADHRRRAENPTYNGTMVILEKLAVTRMNGDTVGFGGEYDIPDVPHAMRLTRPAPSCTATTGRRPTSSAAPTSATAASGSRT